MATKAKESKALLCKIQSLFESVDGFAEHVSGLANTDLEGDAIHSLKFRLESLLPKLDEALEVFTQLRIIETESNVSQGHFENAYFHAVGKARTLLAKIAPEPSMDMRSNTSRDNRNSVKLPSITVPSFSGDIFNFVSFFDTFTAVVDSNEELSDVEKLFYLKQSLRGSAAECVNGMQMTAGNYQIAIENLKSRYDNKKLQILAHLDALFNCNKVVRESAVELRRFSDNIERHFRALDNMRLSDSEFKAAVLAYLIKTKSDTHTASEFIKLGCRDVPSLDDSKQFLSSKCLALESLASMTNKYTEIQPKPFYRNSFNNRPTNANMQIVCPVCNKGDHYLANCALFLELTPNLRYEKVRDLHLCLNCLKHPSSSKCKSGNSCRKCNRKHHTMLCFSNPANSRAKSFNIISDASNGSHQESTVSINNPLTTHNPEISVVSSHTNPTQNTISSLCTNAHIQSPSNILLSTAKVTVAVGQSSTTVKCLLDSGSQCNFVSRSLCNKMQIKTRPFKTTISGINGSACESLSICDLKIRSRYSNYTSLVSCLVVPNVTSQLPPATFNRSLLNIPVSIQLADDTFYESSVIDLLIGADTFYELILPGQFRLGKNMPILQNTTLGYVVSGKVSAISFGSTSNTNANKTNSFHVSINNHDDNLSEAIQQFMTIDNVLPKCKSSLLSPEQLFCEQNFENTTKVGSDGKITVSIPFNYTITQLGETKHIAISRLLNLERRFETNPVLKKEYSKFIQEYQSLGHMTEISELDNTSDMDIVCPSNNFVYLDGSINPTSLSRYFLPHHAVYKPDSLSTRLRVVFDGSCSTTNGKSLNQSQIVGPIIQDDLFAILLRFRLFEVALVADIEKMYRMINIQANQRRLQSIIWRDNPYEKLKVFELNTVTYGTSSASYLATKTLQFIANKYSHDYPEASQTILNNFYMDDWLVSARTKDEIKQLRSQVTRCLSNHGFTLRKFLSNNPDVILDEDEFKERPLYTIPISDKLGTKTLGLNWVPTEDQLYCKTDISTSVVTKRTILSAIAKIFDPIGFLAPIVVTARLLMQELWSIKLDWDDPVPNNIHFKWATFQQNWQPNFPITIQRYVIPSNTVDLQLHGFADASARAFGACVYVRCAQADGSVACSLLCAKSKVAPLRNISIPRLELCAAVLLAQLIQKVIDSISVQANAVFLWIDSTIVLHWINSAPNVHKIFIANRIAVIHEISNKDWWRHVPSTLNSADLISRGSSVPELRENSLWWHGPGFLKGSMESWPANIIQVKNTEQNVLELKQHHSFVTKVVCFDILSRYSSLSKLQHVTAYILRFLNNVKAKLNGDNSGLRRGPLSAAELQQSLILLIRLCQEESFSQEIKLVRTNLNSKLASNIKSLHPFLDKEGCLRVGGRLTYSNFPYDKKYPFLLPKGHKLTALVLEYYHKVFFHCGPQQLLATVREKYWPIGGKNQCKLIIRRCITCARAKPLIQQPLMSDLPQERVSISHPFTNVGVDYAGPILIKEKKIRNTKYLKSYICIFVCLTTRAVHIDLVTDLTAISFVKVLKRFVARRGKPSIIWSDNAKNFSGAASHLRELYKSLYNDTNQRKIFTFLAGQEISWKFISPRAPHEGGMWEASVKSAKFHLKRVLGNIHLDYEDMLTVLIQIEAVLNSRPISPLSTDPDDLTPLTPGHFLIGRALYSIPETDLSNANNPDRLQVFQRSQFVMQCFWRRWQREVVPEMQRRCKWFSRLPELTKVGSVVILQENGIPPLHWKIGIVTEIHRSGDNVIRSASIRLPGGSVVRRSVRQLCVLPAGM